MNKYMLDYMLSIIGLCYILGFSLGQIALASGYPITVGGLLLLGCFFFIRDVMIPVLVDYYVEKEKYYGKSNS